MSRFEATAYILPHFDALTHVVIRVSSALLFVFVKRTYFKSLLKVYYRSVFVESSKAFNTLSKILLWIKPSYFLAWFVTVFGKCVRLLMHASMKPRCLGDYCATIDYYATSTELSSSSAAVVPHKGDLPSCVVAAVVPQIKSTSCVARRRHFIFHHDLSYFRHQKNEHFNK